MEDFDFNAIKPDILTKKHSSIKKIDKKIKKASDDLSKEQADISLSNKRVLEVDDSEDNNDLNDKSVKKTRTEFSVWIGNLSFKTDRASLERYFKKCGDIARIKLPLNGKKMNKGFAYIDFHNESDMNKALALSETYLDGRCLLIKSAQDFDTTGRLPRGGRKPQPHSAKPKDPRKLFIGNLPFDTNETILSNLFSKYGDVESIRVSCFEDTGRCKGFAHIVFKDKSSADKVLAKPIPFKGKILRTEYGAFEERSRQTEEQ